MDDADCQGSVPFPIADWQDEIRVFLCPSHSLCLALFDLEGALLFANPAMRELFKGDPARSFLNPSFATLCELPVIDGTLVYDGFVTIGDYLSTNPSLRSKVFRKRGQLLISCDYDAAQLFELNQSLAGLNQQVNNLQRQLIKDKATLQATLAQLNGANAKLAELNATKDRFFSIIAHDMRSPFNAIVGFSSLLAEQVREQDYDGIGEYAEMIEESSQRALALLVNLLEWSRSQTGRIKFAPADISVKKLLDDGVALVQDAARQKDISLGCEAPADGKLFGDEAMLATVLRNLLANAIKFTPAGGRVMATARADAQSWTIAVQDNGVGITPENQAKLFRLDEFLSTSGTNNEQGTGLGLILCKEFIDKHGGRLWVDSTPGQGSVFFFTIPAKAR